MLLPILLACLAPCIAFDRSHARFGGIDGGPNEMRWQMDGTDYKTWIYNAYASHDSSKCGHDLHTRDLKIGQLTRNKVDKPKCTVRCVDSSKYEVSYDLNCDNIGQDDSKSPLIGITDPETEGHEGTGFENNRLASYIMKDNLGSCGGMNSTNVAEFLNKSKNAEDRIACQRSHCVDDAGKEHQSKTEAEQKPDFQDTGYGTYTVCKGFSGESWIDDEASIFPRRFAGVVHTAGRQFPPPSAPSPSSSNLFEVSKESGECTSFAGENDKQCGADSDCTKMCKSSRGVSTKSASLIVLLVMGCVSVSFLLNLSNEIGVEIVESSINLNVLKETNTFGVIPHVTNPNTPDMSNKRLRNKPTSEVTKVIDVQAELTNSTRFDGSDHNFPATMDTKGVDVQTHILYSSHVDTEGVSDQSNLRVLTMATKDYAARVQALSASLLKFGHNLQISALGWSSEDPNIHPIYWKNKMFLEAKIDILAKETKKLTSGYILWIDADTFVISDVRVLLDNYKHCDVSMTMRKCGPHCDVAAGVILIRVNKITKGFMAVASQNKEKYVMYKGRRKWFQDQVALKIAIDKTPNLRLCNLKRKHHFIGFPHSGASAKLELAEVLYSGRPIPPAILDKQKINFQKISIQRPPFKLNCIIPALKGDKRETTIRQTWGSQCDELNICFVPAERALDGIHEDMFDKLRKCYRSSNDMWVFKADLDTYVNVQELRAYIKTLPRFNVFAGLRLTEPVSKKSFNSGGAGFLMSPDVVKKFSSSDTDACTYSKNMLWTDERSKKGKYCDVRVAWCLSSFGVTPADTRENGKERFHPFSFAKMKLLNLDTKSWYWTHSSQSKKNTLVSDHSITFHRLQASEMRRAFEADWCKTRNVLPNGAVCSKKYARMNALSQHAVKRSGDFDKIDESRPGQSGSDMTDKRLRYKPTSKVNGLQAEIPNVGHHDLNTHTINFRDEFASRVRGKAVEIGTFDGNFASNNIAKFKGDYFMVDIAVRPKLQERLVAWKENPQVHFLKMTSQLASTKFGDKTLDWIYVDARHDYKSVLEDIQNWWAKLKPGGLFSGHDYCVSKNELGTYQDVPWCGCCYADGRNYASQVASVKAVREFARSKGLKICHTMEGRKDVSDAGKGASWWYCGSALGSALLTTEDTVKSNVLQAEIPDVDSPEGDHHPEGAFDEAEWCKTHNVLPNGAFCSKKYAGMDAPLATALLSQIPTGSSVCDLGAGGGWYTDFFNKHELTSHAYDASPTRASHVEYLDLTKPLNDHKECDWTLCLEVGEHVPSSTNNIFLDNIDKFSKHGVILSWAVPGQGGNGHINCQTNEWVIEKMQSRGFKYDKEASTRLRNAASFGWFKNTVMVFSKLTEVLTSCTWQQEFPPEKINCDVAQSTQICKVYESIATMYSWNDGNGYMDEGYFHKNLIGPLVSGAVLTLIRDGRFNYGSSDNDVDLPYASPALLPKIKAQAKSIRVSPEAVDRNKDFFEYNCICALPNGGTALCLEDSLAYARLEYGPSWWIPDLLIKSWFNYGAVKLITEKWVTPAVNSIKKYDKNDDGEITPDEVPIPERLKGKLTAFDLTQGIRQMNMILSGDARKIPDLPYKHAVLIGRNNDLSNKLREIGFRVYFLTKDIDKNTSIMRALNFLKGNLFSGTDRDSDTKIVFSVFLDSFQTKDMDLVKRIYESNFETSPDFETTPDVFFVSSSGVNKLIKTIEMKMKKNQ